MTTKNTTTADPFVEMDLEVRQAAKVDTDKKEGTETAYKYSLRGASSTGDLTLAITLTSSEDEGLKPGDKLRVKVYDPQTTLDTWGGDPTLTDAEKEAKREADLKAKKGKKGKQATIGDATDDDGGDA